MQTRSTATGAPVSQLARRRKWKFRILALILAMTPWGVAELTLQMLERQPRSDFEDPFIGFDSEQPLFQLGEQGQLYRTAENRQVYFRPQEFGVDKGPNEIRIFVIGGSTVQGRPYEAETAFSTWLQIALSTAEPSKKWTVVNCGGVSYASYRLVPIVDEVLNYDPDLVVICTGNNEFLEHRTYEDYLSQPLWQRKLSGWSRNIALVRAAQRFLQADETELRERLPVEVDAELDYEDAMESYQRDDHWTRAVQDHFRESLRRMALKTRAAQVPVWLVLPPTNLRDCPPFKSERMGAARQVEDRLTDALQDGWYSRPLTERKALLEMVLQEEPRFALAQYWQGKCFDEEGDYENAAKAYQAAIDEDICPLRATQSTLQILREHASRFDWALVDAPSLLSTSCRGGITDQTILEDHVHPKIQGHQSIGLALLERARTEWGLSNREEVDQQVQKAFRKHLDSLPSASFERGRGRLEALNRWARGRAIGAKARRGKAARSEL